MPTQVDASLERVDQFFMAQGPVHKTMRDLARRLECEDIDYSVIGGMALVLHGYERLTVDVDLLMTREGLAKFVERLVGRGYMPAFPAAKKHFRDVETGVNIEIITTGEYPGDGKPKPVSFPDPSRVSEIADGIKVIDLATLIELKLASGLSAEHRVKDIADVQQLIETLNLSRAFQFKLDQSVRDEYDRLWEATRRAREERIGPDQE
jgi:hypothetical protein